MDSIDLQIAEFSRNPLTPNIRLDPRVGRFWKVDAGWVIPGDQAGPYEYSPIRNGLDLVYGRYTLGIFGQGLTTEDYWVMDSENPFYEVSLEEFLVQDEKGELPVEMTRNQKIRHKINTIGLSLSALAILAFTIFLVHHLMVHAVVINASPDGNFVLQRVFL